MEREKNEITIQAIEEKPYTLRKLKNSDFWPVVKILGKLFPDDIKSAFVQTVSREKSVKEVGYMVFADIAAMIVKNSYRAQDEVDKFCADLAGITIAEMNEMEFGTSAMIIMDVVKDAGNASFFKVLSKFFS